MKASKAIDIVMSVVVAVVLMAGGFARFHHHTHDNRTCFCFTLSDAKAHTEAHSHGHDANDSCDHSSGEDCCGFILDDFQISQDNDSNDDISVCLPLAILPCLATVAPHDDTVSAICHRCLKPLIAAAHHYPAGLRAPPMI